MVVVMTVMVMVVMRCGERGIGAKEHDHGNQTGYLHENISH
jgi:hypothetical protein